MKLNAMKAQTHTESKVFSKRRNVFYPPCGKIVVIC